MGTGNRAWNRSEGAAGGLLRGTVRSNRLRSRNLKPGFFTNEELAACEPMARLLFAGLWCLADREGRLEDRPARIRGQVFPFDAPNMEDLLDQLSKRNFIRRYEVQGTRCISISNFVKHAKPHPDEACANLPKPPEISGDFIRETTLTPLPSLPSSSLNPSSLYMPPSGGLREEGKKDNPANSNTTPGPSVKASPTRPRDDLFDAVASVTASDPVVSGSHIGRLCKLLRKADPAYTPDEVRAWAELVQSLAWWEGGSPSLGFMEKDIGRIRAKPAERKAKPDRLTQAILNARKGKECPKSS